MAELDEAAVLSCGKNGRESEFEAPIPKFPTTRRSRHEAHPRSVAESGREKDPRRAGLHCNRDYVCALGSGVTPEWYSAKNVAG
jgi:hypothetical protein